MSAGRDISGVGTMYHNAGHLTLSSWPLRARPLPLRGEGPLQFTPICLHLRGFLRALRGCSGHSPSFPLHLALGLQVGMRKGSWDMATPRELKPPDSLRVSAMKQLCPQLVGGTTPWP